MKIKMELVANFMLAPRSGSRAQFATRMIASIPPLIICLANLPSTKKPRTSAYMMPDWASLGNLIKTTVYIWSWLYLIYRQKFSWLSTTILCIEALILTITGLDLFLGDGSILRKFFDILEKSSYYINEGLVWSICLTAVFSLFVDLLSEKNRCSLITD